MHPNDSTLYDRNGVSIDRGCDLVQVDDDRHLVQVDMNPETVLEVAEEMKTDLATHNKEVTNPKNLSLRLRGAAKKVITMQRVIKELDPEGESHEKRVFAYRPPGGSDKCFEFKKKHAKFISALNEHLLPKFGGFPGGPLRPAEAKQAEAKQAEEAYREFLLGLDLVNQSEHIKPDDIPLGQSAEELYKWERQIRGAGMHMCCLQIYKQVYKLVLQLWHMHLLS